MRLWHQFVMGLACSGALSACPLCEPASDRQVPFKLDPAPDPASAEPPTTAVVAPEGVDVDPGRAELDVQGVRLRAPSGLIRAAIVDTRDDSGSTSAPAGLLLTAASDGATRLHRVPIRGETVGSPAAVADLFAPAPGCQLGQAHVASLDPRVALAWAERRCGPEAQAEGRLVVVDWDESTSLLLQLSTLPATEPGQALSLRGATADHDGDGHTDLAVQIQVGEGRETVELTVHWLNRPGGLVRDDGEPGQTVGRLLAAAVEGLGGEAGPALAAAERLRAFYGSLCRDAEDASLGVGELRGLPCGSGEIRERVGALYAAALTANDRLPEALAALSALAPERRAAVEGPLAAAAQRLPTTPDLQATAGPSLPSRRADAATAGFYLASDTELVITAGSGLRHDLRTGETSPAPEVATEGLVDPSGKLQLTTLSVTCEGVVGSVVKLGLDGSVRGAGAIAEPLLVPAAVEPCRTRSLDELGAVVLGWAPQGLVTARRTSLYVTAMTAQGQALAPPRQLAEGQPPPAPLRGGAATPNGDTHVFPTPFGIVLREHRSGRLSLFRPRGLPAAAAADSAVVSPSGQTIAASAGGRVWHWSRTPH